MKIQWLAPVCALVVLTGCATQPHSALAPAMRVAPPTAHVARSNRFDMTQNGRRMTADDFDAWMKARGIRIAQGESTARKPTKPRASASTKRSQRR